MDWKVDYTKTFLKELASLPKDVQHRAEDIVFRQLPFTNPFEAGYVERMKGYRDKYKIRMDLEVVSRNVFQDRTGVGVAGELL